MKPQRERISAEELREVLEHFDLGPVASAREFPRGSRRSAKVIVETTSGRYVLKRPAAGHDDPQRHAFAHRLLEHLRRRGIPTPSLARTHAGDRSVLRLHGHTYEIYEYAQGDRYAGTLEQTSSAGLMLARLHRALMGYPAEPIAQRPSYHDNDSIRDGLLAIPGAVAPHDSVVGHEAELLSIVQELRERYDQAAEAVRNAGFADWAVHTVHGDWHPGNLLFRDSQVAAVIDLESARLSPLALDLANGLLQFSIIWNPDAPEQWPEYFDMTRMRRFYRGYAARIRLPAEERQAIPQLMIESLVGESAVPIAATGSFGHMPGFGVMQTIRRKVHWLIRNLDGLRSWLVE